MAKFYFSEGSAGKINIRGGSSDGGMLSDFDADIGPGESFFGVSFEDMRKAGSGEIETTEAGARIVG